MRIIKLISMVVVFGIVTTSINSQEKCKVLKPDIAGEYSGECKNGLASGQGISKGENIYEGKFKKGLPNGKGTIIYVNGEKYIGKWKNGLKHGEGKYILKLNGIEKIEEGIWKKGKFIGKKPVKGYKIIKKTSVTRYTITKVGDNFNRVTIRVKSNGQDVNNLQNITGSSGNRVNYLGYSAFENIYPFPFTCEMRYYVPNKMATYQILVEFIFEITEPGDWLVKILH